MQLISRVVGGWNVRIALNGKRGSRFFADTKFGGKNTALKAARAHRDAMVARRKPRTQKAVPLLVNRGSTQCYQIRLPKAGGGTTTTEFSVRVHGPRGAKRLATDAWKAATRKLQTA